MNSCHGLLVLVTIITMAHASGVVEGEIGLKESNTKLVRGFVRGISEQAEQLSVVSLVSGFDPNPRPHCLRDDIIVGPCEENAQGDWVAEPKGNLELAARYNLRDPNPKAKPVYPLLEEHLKASDLGDVEDITPSSAVRTSLSSRWPNGVVPYTVQAEISGMSNSGYTTTMNRINEAIRELAVRTAIRLVPRTTETSYVAFTYDTGCSSFLGRTGGSQAIRIFENCARGSFVHEVMHALGFYHEQSRSDRDSYVTIDFTKIQSGRSNNFNKITSSGMNLNAYDYGSIMHYGETAFSTDGSKTITPLTVPFNAYKAIHGSDFTIGQRDEMSTVDVKSIQDLYNVCFDAPAQSNPFYKAEVWNKCSSSCSAPGRTRVVACHTADGQCSTSEAPCSGLTKPVSSESCIDMLSTDFDNGNGAWDMHDTDGDTMNWQMGWKSTASSSTGPSGDHTSGNGYYVFLEASGKTSTDKAYLTSIPMSWQAGSTLTFWYHKYGASNGRIEVVIAGCDGTTTSLSNITDSSQNQWKKHTVNLPAATTSRLRIIGHRGSSFQGDWAIDDIAVSAVGGSAGGSGGSGGSGGTGGGNTNNNNNGGDESSSGGNAGVIAGSVVAAVVVIAALVGFAVFKKRQNGSVGRQAQARVQQSAPMPSANTQPISAKPVYLPPPSYPEAQAYVEPEGYSRPVPALPARSVNVNNTSAGQAFPASTYSKPLPRIPVQQNTLPPNWEKYTDDNGYEYYYNSVTGQSQWEVPTQ